MVKAPAGVAVNPVPFNVNASADPGVTPFKSNTAPELTDVPDADVPNAAVFPVFKVPAVIVVSPEYVLVPDKSNSPAPYLFKSKAPDTTPVIVIFPVVPTPDALANATVPL